jgi:hypothetical protein
MTSLLPDVGAALGQTIFGTGGKPFTDPNRVPMVFTSLRRLRAINADLKTFIGEETPIIDTASVDANLQTDLEDGQRPIIQMAVNPNTITFRQPKRIVKRDTQNGSVFFHFTNSKGQNNDILTLDFRGNTGNLDPRGDVNSSGGGVFDTQGGYNTGAISKLALYHNLWSLTREPMLLEDNTINEFIILYSSIAIPVEIQLNGFFSQVLEWTDSAEKPFSKDYSFSFTVQDIIPPLAEVSGLLQSISFDTETTAGQT